MSSIDLKKYEHERSGSGKTDQFWSVGGENLTHLKCPKHRQLAKLPFQGGESWPLFGAGQKRPAWVTVPKQGSCKD